MRRVDNVPLMEPDAALPWLVGQRSGPLLKPEGLVFSWDQGWADKPGAGARPMGGKPGDRQP